MENYLYYSDPFFAYNNALYIEKTVNGKPVNIKLSNFLARITEDITCTNGAENERYLSIVGTDDKGKDLRKITVPLKNFAQLDWAQEYWGINCVIEALQHLYGCSENHFKKEVKFWRIIYTIQTRSLHITTHCI